MLEAAILGRMGMPQAANRFTLILDGKPTPERTSEIFDQVVQRDAAWQEALVRSFAVHHPEDSERLFMINWRCYYFRAFPHLLKDLASGKTSSCIRCNFDTGRPWDVDEMVKAHPGWDPDQWENGWYGPVGGWVVPTKRGLCIAAPAAKMERSHIWKYA